MEMERWGWQGRKTIAHLQAGSDPGAQRSHVGVIERKWKWQDGGGKDRRQ